MTQSMARMMMSIVCQLALARAVVDVVSICTAIICVLIKEMNQVYCLIFVRDGYMMADMEEFDEAARKNFIDLVSFNHPICVVDMTTDDMTMMYRAHRHDLSDSICDRSIVVEVCEQVLRRYQSDPEWSVYPLSNLIDRDMSKSMLQLSLDNLSIEDEPVDESDAVKLLTSRIDELEEMVNDMSELIKRLSVQYGILTQLN